MLFGRELRDVFDQMGEALATSGFAIVLLYLMNASSLLMALVFIAVFVLGYLLNSSVALVCGLFLSFSLVCVGALLLGQFQPSYSFSGSAVVLITFLMAIAIAIGVKKVLRNLRTVHLFEVLIPFVLIFGTLTKQSRIWNSSSAFGVLVNNGEDNAAWLVALSRSVVNNQTQLSASGGASGGPSTGFFVAFSRELFSRVDANAIVANADNALVLLRMYALVAVLVAMVWVVTTSVVLATAGSVARIGFALVSAVAGFSFVLGLAAVGHFSAVVAVFFLSVAVLFLEVLPSETITEKLIARSSIFLALVAAGQAWFPLTAIALFYLAALALQSGHSALAEKKFGISIQSVVLIALGSLSVGYLMYEKVFPNFLKNAFDLDFVIYNLTLAGGYSTVNPWLVVIGFAVCLWWGFQIRTDVFSRAALVIAFFIPVSLMFIWSYFLAPFTPQYGAWKYLYIVAAVAVPWGIVALGNLFGRLFSKGLVSYFPVAILLTLGLFSPPFEKTFWIETTSTASYEWTKTVVNELRESPQRPVACSNSIKDDDGQKYNAYLCSRMSLGLGGFDDIRHRVWTAAAYCSVPNTQLESEWPLDQQRNLSVILFDPTRTSSLAGCQTPSAGYPTGLLSSVDWSVIRKLSPTGEVVYPVTTKVGDKIVE